MPAPRITIQRGRSRLRVVAERIGRELDRAVAATAERVHENARATVPYLTGNLQRSHQVEPGQGAHEQHVTAGGVTPGSPGGASYAGIIHDGKNKRPPRPWLQQATLAEEATFAADVTEAVRKGAR